VIVTLLTDFGWADHYVASMKGVLYSVNPAVRIVDISHDVPAHDVGRAAFLLEACYRDFPVGTVHLAVVDPGVGSPRRALALSAGGYFFVGPDNGLFGSIVETTADVRVRSIEPDLASSRAVSSTFHGRDIFAPAAAALAAGRPLDDLGPPAGDVVALDQHRTAPGAEGEMESRILHIDRFGNCITGYRAEDFPDGKWGDWIFSVGAHEISRTRRFYAEGTDAEPFMIEGSSAHLEVAVDRGSAAESLRAATGDVVTAKRRVSRERLSAANLAAGCAEIDAQTRG